MSFDQRLRRAFIQEFQNACPRAVQAAFYGSDCTIAYLSRFFVADAEHTDQHQYFTLMCRKRLDRSINVLAPKEPVL